MADSTFERQQRQAWQSALNQVNGSVMDAERRLGIDGINREPFSANKFSNPWNGVGQTARTAKANAPFTENAKAPAKFRTGGFLIGAGIDTVLNMKGGDDFGTAAVKGAFTGMLWTTMPGIMFASEIAQAAPAAIEGYNNWMREKQGWWNQQFLPNFGGGYQDTRKALTMRQAGVEAIQGSKLNARSALGGEARLIANNFNRG